MSVWQRSLLGMVSGAGSVFIKAALNIVVIPALIARLGLDAFGLYILLIAILEVATLLDLGACGSMVTFLGGEKLDSAERRALLKVGQAWFFWLSLVFLGVGLLFWPHFSAQFHIATHLQPVAQWGFFLILVESVLMLLSCYARAILLAHCAHQWTNLADTLYYLVSNVGGLILLLFGFGLSEILEIRLLGALFRLLMMSWHACRIEPFAAWPGVPFQMPIFKKVAHLSGHATMINFSIIVSHKIDDIVIASFLPISAVGIYEVVFRFLGIVIQVCLKLHEGIYPLFSKMAAAKQVGEAAQLFVRMSSFLNMATGLMLMLILGFYPQLFAMFSAGKIPLGQTIPVLLVAIPCVWSGVLQMPANAWLFTWGHQRYLTVSSLLAALANLVLSLLLVQSLGVVGVALGTLIPQLIQHQASLIRKTCQELHVSGKTYLRDVYGVLLWPLLLAFLIMYALRLLGSALPGGLNIVMMAGIAAIAGSLGAMVWFRTTATPAEVQFCCDLMTNKLGCPVPMTRVTRWMMNWRMPRQAADAKVKSVACLHAAERKNTAGLDVPQSHYATQPGNT